MKNAEVYDSLQREFCPPLDGSLLTALLNDIFYNDDGAHRSPTKEELERLRLTLQELVFNAEEEQYTEDSRDLGFSSTSDESCTSPDLLTSEGWTTASSETSLDFDAPLHFLRAALPDIPITILQDALSDRDEIDMEEIVDDILSKQYIRELEERGLDSLPPEQVQSHWNTVQKKKQGKAKQVITLGDVRQRSLTQSSISITQSSPDPWTSISSVSTHLATIIPYKAPSFFQSYFHSPKYSKPYDAVYAALIALRSDEYEYDDILFSLLDILVHSYPNCPPSVLVADAEIAISSTKGDGDAALDLIHLLRSLDDDSTGGPRHHAPPPQITSASAPTSPVLHTKLPEGPPAPVLPSNYKHPTQAQQIRHRNKPSPYQWQAVPIRKPPNKAYEHSAYIPEYSYSSGKHKSPGNAAGKGGKGDVGELTYRRRMEENLRMRKEMVKEASRMWQKGSKKNRGGEVAFYFAERAREFQEQAQKESLNAARAMVQAKMRTSREKNVVDLHGLTSTEAITVVKEIIAEKPPTSGAPLTVITGRGTHSANNVSVLKPLVHAALVKDGWRVGVGEASLFVRGR